MSDTPIPPPPVPATTVPLATPVSADGHEGETGLLDVVAMGSPLVDVIASVEDADLGRLELVKGSTALVELDRSQAIYDAIGPTVEVSGGSAANTAVGVASLGGTAGFVGKVADDPLGQVFTHDIRASGVTFFPGALADPQIGTGRCLVLVTEDAERTMATHLGAANTIKPHDVPTHLVARSRLLYLEGYLWDVPAAKEAMRRAVAECHENDGAVALSLSDPFCVERHRADFLDLIRDHLDVLLGNEQELTMLFGAKSLDAALDAAEETGILMAVTRGPLGSVVVTASGRVPVPAAPVDRVVDTTGAGDLFAAGFLFGLTHGADPEGCAVLGHLCAAEVISHMGARPARHLRPLVAEAGLA